MLRKQACFYTYHFCPNFVSWLFWGGWRDVGKITRELKGVASFEKRVRYNTKIQGKIWLELEFNTCTQIIIVKCTTTTKNWWKYSKAIFHFKVYRHLGLWGGEGASTRVNALGTPYLCLFFLTITPTAWKLTINKSPLDHVHYNRVLTTWHFYPHTHKVGLTVKS